MKLAQRMLAVFRARWGLALRCRRARLASLVRSNLIFSVGAPRDVRSYVRDMRYNHDDRNNMCAGHAYFFLELAFVLPE